MLHKCMFVLMFNIRALHITLNVFDRWPLEIQTVYRFVLSVFRKKQNKTKESKHAWKVLRKNLLEFNDPMPVRQYKPFPFHKIFL